jgi:F-type H+-transporting ATPase subunit delta
MNPGAGFQPASSNGRLKTGPAKAMSPTEPTRHETVFDDATQHVARVYSEALLNVAEKAGQTAELLAELDALIGEVFPRDRYLEEFLYSRAVGRDRKTKAFVDALKGRANDLLLNFLLVLNNHDRLDALRPIAQAAHDLYNQRTGKMPVTVRSAVPLADEQRERLRQDLRAAFGKEPILSTAVDPELLGGLTVQVGDVLYDGSVRSRVQRIRNQIIERSSYAIQSGRDRFSS